MIVNPSLNIVCSAGLEVMTQFASQGQWGRGLYFAEEAKYSHFFATNAETLPPDVREAKRMQTDELELMMVTLLIGNTVEMDRDRNVAMADACKALKTAPAVEGCEVEQAADGFDSCTHPPDSDATGFKYDTVTGFTQTDKKLDNGSWVKNPDCPRSRVWSKQSQRSLSIHMHL